MLQNKFRLWQSRHPSVRKRARQSMVDRKRSAQNIQKHYRSHKMAIACGEKGEFIKDKRQDATSWKMGKTMLAATENFVDDRKASQEAATTLLCGFYVAFYQ